MRADKAAVLGALNDIMTWGLDASGSTRSVKFTGEMVKQGKLPWKYINWLLTSEANGIQDINDYKHFMPETLDKDGNFDQAKLADYGLIYDEATDRLMVKHVFINTDEFKGTLFEKIFKEYAVDGASLIVNSKYREMLMRTNNVDDTAILKPKYYQSDDQGNSLIYKSAYFMQNVDEYTKNGNPLIADFFNKLSSQAAVISFTTASKGNQTFRTKKVMRDGAEYLYDVNNNLVNVRKPKADDQQFKNELDKAKFEEQSAKQEEDLFTKEQERLQQNLSQGILDPSRIVDIPLSGENAMQFVDYAHPLSNLNSVGLGINSTPMFNRLFDAFNSDNGQKAYENLMKFEDRAVARDMKKASDILTLRSVYDKLMNQYQSDVPVQPVNRKFQGGFENVGKGTEIGDGKDKAMREIANAAIVERVNNNPSSTKTTIDQLGNPNENSNIIMLARNGKLSGKPLTGNTKKRINDSYQRGSKFVVGDMPNVDSQFIDYLDEIGADYTVYHTGSKARIADKSINVEKQKTSISNDELVRSGRAITYLADKIKGYTDKQLVGS